MKKDIESALGELPEGLSPYAEKNLLASRESIGDADKGHGRLEHRTLVATPLLNGYLRRQGWPDVGQVFRLVRRRTTRGRTTRGRTSEEVAYGITSLTPGEASPRRLLELVRGHWAIENSLHYVRGVTLGEDACRVRAGSAPQLLAALRNLVLSLVAPLKAPSNAAALRTLAAKPKLAVRLVTQTSNL